MPVIVENRAGAGGNAGAAEVARSYPDGYTLLMASSGILTANPHLYSTMPFDVNTAFAPISNVADMPVVLVVHPQVEARSLAELVRFAKRHPGKLNFGSAGVGTSVHLSLLMLMQAAAIEITHIPYKGAGPAMSDLLAGQIDGILPSAPTVITHIHSGKLRALAVMAQDRIPQLSEVPTAAEQGLDAHEVSPWFGLLAPAGTSKGVIDRLHNAVSAAVRTKTMQQRFSSLGARMLGDTPQAFAIRIAAERKSLGDVIKVSGVKPQ